MIKIRFIKDFATWKVGDTGEASKRSAEDFVNNGYAEYVEEVKKEIVREIAKGYQKVEATEILKQEKARQELESYKENEINWLEDDFYDSWDKVKGHTKNLFGHHKTGDLNDSFEPMKKIFLAHSKDKIVGKPQIAIQTQVQIPLIREMVSIIKDDDKTEKQLFKYMFFDEKVDTRYKGYQKSVYSLDFRLYRVIDSYDKEYFVLSQEILPNCSCELEGMIIEMEYTGEIKRSIGLKQISKFFLMKTFNPSIKILSREKLVEFTKLRKIGESEWRNFLDLHPNGNFNRFIPEVNSLRDSFILSGKRDGYPLHLTIFGPPGTGKSKGHLETLDYKFNENTNILDGGNSRIKMLTPSFKERPANLGYLARAERLAFIDEIGKMIEFEINKHQTAMQNILGETTSLLDHVEKVVGSGNDNECRVQATAKQIIVSNPVSNRTSIQEHVGLIDPPALSRQLIWVQDKEEQKFIFSGKLVERIPPHTHTNIHTQENSLSCNKKNKNENVYLCVGGVTSSYVVNIFSSREEFLTLFDTCNSFVCDIEEPKVREIYDSITFLAKEPMKSSVWKPRGEHHVYLLVDGICKHRCLFKDYDSTFTPKQEDYDLAEKILIRMVKSWDTDLSPKEEFR